MTTYDSTDELRPFAVNGFDTQDPEVSQLSAKTSLERRSCISFTSSAVSNHPLHHNFDGYNSLSSESAHSEVLEEALSSSPPPNQLGRKRRRLGAQSSQTKQISESPANSSQKSTEIARTLTQRINSYELKTTHRTTEDSRKHAADRLSAGSSVRGNSQEQSTLPIALHHQRYRTDTIPQALNNEVELGYGMSSQSGQFSDILVPSTAEQNRQKQLKANHGSSPTAQSQPSHAIYSLLDIHSAQQEQIDGSGDEIRSEDYLDMDYVKSPATPRKNTDQGTARKEKSEKMSHEVKDYRTTDLICSSPPQHQALDDTTTEPFQRNSHYLDRSVSPDRCQYAWPKWGNASESGGRGVWIQWGQRMEIACLSEGEDVPWTSFSPKKGLSLLHQELAVTQDTEGFLRPIRVLFPTHIIGYVPPNNIKMLDLQLGDLIKVDQYKRQTFQIMQLVDTRKASLEAIERMAQEQANNWEIIVPDLHSVRLRDINGSDYTIVKAIKPPFPKTINRQGSSATNPHAQVDEKVYAVPLNQTYLTPSLWSVYLQRRTKLKENSTTFAGKRANSELPVRRSRKESMKAESFATQNENNQSICIREGGHYKSQLTDDLSDSENDKHTGDTSEAQTAGEENAIGFKGIFSEYLFCFTTHTTTGTLDMLFLRNGGTIATNGFNDLMSLDNNGELRLQGRAKKFKFAAVVATGLLRTRKFQEALALGWPCLCPQFIIDCVLDPYVLQEWESYVLCSGASKILGNAIRSSHISVFSTGWSNNWSLEDQFKCRKRILACIKLPLYLVEHKALTEVIIESKPFSKLKVEPRKPRDDALCHIYHLILLMMGCDHRLINIVRTIKDLKKLQSVDTSETGVIVIHMESPDGKRNSTVKSKGPLCDQPLSQLYRTVDRKLWRRLRNGERVAGLIQYNREWLVQNLINGWLV